jgi:hypothetical protein
MIARLEIPDAFFLRPLFSPWRRKPGTITRRKQRNAVLNQAPSEHDPIAMGRLYL